MKESLVTWGWIHRTLSKLDEDIQEISRAIDEIDNFDLAAGILKERRSQLTRERTAFEELQAPASGV